jgi:short-subunit dehydrogenase
MQALAYDLRDQFKVDVTVIGAALKSNAGVAKLHAEIKAPGLVLSALVSNARYGAFGEFERFELASKLAIMQLYMNTVVVLTWGYSCQKPVGGGTW